MSQSKAEKRNPDVLYTLEDLPDPRSESHHSIIVYDFDTQDLTMLTKHWVVHKIGPLRYFSYVGWADATDEEPMS